MAKKNSPGCACCGCSFTFTIRDCTTNALVSGATVTVKDSGGTTVDSGTTGAGGTYTATIPSLGSYTAVVVKTGQPTVTKPVSLFCGAGMTILLGVQYAFIIKGCNAIVLPGATVSLVGATDGETMSGTTNGSGAISFFPSKAQVFNYTVSYARFNNATGTIGTSGGCGTFGLTLTLTAASGYVCYLPTQTCLMPIPTTLNYSNSVWGTSGTLTYSGGSGWIHGTTRNFAACPAKSCSAATGVTIGHTLDNGATANPTGGLSWHTVSGVNNCPGGSVNTAGVAFISPTLTCSPFSLTVLTNTADARHDFGFCGSQSTITITE